LQLLKYFYVSLICILAACNGSYKKTNPQRFQQDSALVLKLIKQGDSIYAQKASFSTFSKSLDLYDTAWQIAQQTADTNLIANAIFAKGRAYDAMNSNPQKTIDYYTQAAQLFAAMPDNEVKALYIKHLVAHSYDKVQDSINCIKVLTELYAEILHKPDTLKQQMQFIAEMALISTEVKNYVLADSILQQLTKREWIKNDSTEYDYLNHYYLTKARIAVYFEGNAATQYIDSVETIFSHCKNLGDSMYYSSQLWSLYKAVKNTHKESYYLQLNNAIFNTFNTPENIRQTQSKLAKLEVAAVETQRIAELEKAHIRKRYFYALAALLAVISVLALFLNKRNKEIRRKQQEVQISNEQLQQKNLQNELLNKEIHHRVKNNLQMIMSLVNMQENNSQTDEVKENMQAISLRIESIANLHQQLMEQTDEVNLKKYIQHLVSNLSNVLGDGKKIITHLQIASIKVPQKISFPLGLIINEWITNSVKYAKPATGFLEIKIELGYDQEKIKINYTDNGEPQLTRQEKKSLGLDIVSILTQQLEGTIETQPQNIFNYKLTIPLNNGE
jgi:two-component sensor histidine kinase